MKAYIETSSGLKKIDLSRPMGIHLPIENEQRLGAWYLSPPSILPHKNGNFIGSVSQGAAINFNDIMFNPHAHGTHTECVGHIIEGDYKIMQSMSQFFFEAILVSVGPQNVGNDLIISEEVLSKALKDKAPAEALIIRTLPNPEIKKQQNYSHSNPPYLTEAAAVCIREWGVKHVLIDLPSIDKEEDGGALLAHRAFWDVGGVLRTQATITEFIFVPSKIEDGRYALQFGLAPFVNDASPSSVFLYNMLDSSSDFLNR